MMAGSRTVVASSETAATRVARSPPPALAAKADGDAYMKARARPTRAFAAPEAPSGGRLPRVGRHDPHVPSFFFLSPRASSAPRAPHRPALTPPRPPITNENEHPHGHPQTGDYAFAVAAYDRAVAATRVTPAEEARGSDEAPPTTMLLRATVLCNRALASLRADLPEHSLEDAKEAESLLLELLSAADPGTADAAKALLLLAKARYRAGAASAALADDQTAAVSFAGALAASVQHACAVEGLVDPEPEGGAGAKAEAKAKAKAEASASSAAEKERKNQNAFVLSSDAARIADALRSAVAKLPLDAACAFAADAVKAAEGPPGSEGDAAGLRASAVADGAPGLFARVIRGGASPGIAGDRSRSSAAPRASRFAPRLSARDGGGASAAALEGRGAFSFSSSSSSALKPVRDPAAAMSSAALARTLADADVAASRERERRDDLATYVVSDAIARGADASVDAFEAFFYLEESSHRSNARTGGPADRSASDDDERTSLSSLVRRRVRRVASRFRRACGFEAETHADVELWFVASARARAFLARGSADAEASRRGAVNVAGVPVPPSLSGRSEHQRRILEYSHHSEEDDDDDAAVSSPGTTASALRTARARIERATKDARLAVARLAARDSSGRSGRVSSTIPPLFFVARRRRDARARALLAEALEATAAFGVTPTSRDASEGRPVDSDTPRVVVAAAGEGHRLDALSADARVAAAVEWRRAAALDPRRFKSVFLAKLKTLRAEAPGLVSDAFFEAMTEEDDNASSDKAASDTTVVDPAERALRVLEDEKWASAPEYVRPRPKYYYLYEWMRERIEARFPSLPEPVMDKLLATDADELDLLLKYPKAIEGQVNEYLDVFHGPDGAARLPTYETPRLAWDDVKANERAGAVGLGPDGNAIGGAGPDDPDAAMDRAMLGAAGDGGLTPEEEAGLVMATGDAPKKKGGRKVLVSALPPDQMRDAQAAGAKRVGDKLVERVEEEETARGDDLEPPNAPVSAMDAAD